MYCAAMRATMSVKPPGAVFTMILTGFEGNASAPMAGFTTARASAATAARVVQSNFSDFMEFPSAMDRGASRGKRAQDCGCVGDGLEVPGHLLDLPQFLRRDR